MVHEVIGKKHLFPKGGRGSCGRSEDRVDAPLNPRGTTEVLVQKIPKTFRGRLSYPRDLVARAFLYDVPYPG